MFVSVVNFTYADETIGEKVDSYADSVTSNKYVSKVMSVIKTGLDYLKAGWNKFKAWFSKLPGIKQYNESIYAGDNWNKTMGSMGNEYRPHTDKNSASAQASANLLKAGRKKFNSL